MEILHEKNRKEKIAILLILAALVVSFVVLVNLVLRFNTVQTLVMSWILTTLYSLFAFIFIEPARVNVSKIVERPVQVVKEVPVEKKVFIDRPVIKIKEVPVEKKIYVDRPVIKEVPIQIPMENIVYEVVEKQVPVEKKIYIDRPVYVDRKVYVEKPRKKLVIPKYKYVASTQTKRYHTRFCRLGKLVKKKFKIHNNSQNFFRKKHFKACKMCIKKK